MNAMMLTKLITMGLLIPVHQALNANGGMDKFPTHIGVLLKPILTVVLKTITIVAILAIILVVHGATQ